MKTGDPKQAAALGIVALAAIGFVGSSAFKTIQQNSFSGPVKVVELRDEATPRSSTDPSAPPRSEPTATDIFADSFTPPPPPPESENLVKFGSVDTAPPTSPTKFTETPPEPLPGVPDQGDSDDSQTKREPEVVKPPPKTKAIQYLGFIESSSASAILTVDGANVTVTVGESLGDGFVITAISSEALTVKSKTGIYKISIGKERQI